MEQKNLIFNENYEKTAEGMLGMLAHHMRETSDMLDMGEIYVKEFRENYLRLWDKL